MLKTLQKDVQKHNLHYFILFFGLLLGAIAYFAFIGLPFYRVAAVILTGVFYFFWGVIHHLLLKDLHIKIALEYLFVSIIGCGLLLSIILRS